MISAKFHWYWPSDSGEEDFIKSLIIICPWKTEGPFIWTNLNPLHPKMICAKFGWNWPRCSGEENFSNSSMYFPYFGNYLPLAKGGALHMNKFNSPSPKFGWNWPSGSGEDENVKSLQQQRRRRGWWTTYKFWSEKLTWVFGSGKQKMDPWVFMINWAS